MTPDEIDADDPDQKAFEDTLVRALIVYLLSYVAVGIAVTWFSISTGSHWWILGWGWPALLMFGIWLGSTVEAWRDSE